MNNVLKYSQTISALKKEYKRISLRLRKTRQTKKACEDAGYLMYYPSILSKLSEFTELKKDIHHDIRTYSQLLKEEINHEQNIN
jgi:hypothetical protein